MSGGNFTNGRNNVMDYGANQAVNSYGKYNDATPYKSDEICDVPARALQGIAGQLRSVENALNETLGHLQIIGDRVFDTPVTTLGNGVTGQGGGIGGAPAEGSIPAIFACIDRVANLSVLLAQAANRLDGI